MSDKPVMIRPRNTMLERLGGRPGVPGKVDEIKTGREVGEVTASNKLMSKLIAQALACGQTRVFNVVIGANGLRQPGKIGRAHV